LAQTIKFRSGDLKKLKLKKNRCALFGSLPGLGAGIDHGMALTPYSLNGRGDWLGCWVEFVQKARFKKLVCLCHTK